MNQNLYFQRGIQIITKLNEITPQAYFIGGVVRDYLLNEPFNDIDIATSATPEQILKLFPNAIEEFAEYGCITLKEENMIFEITTFREEAYANVSRKPSEIHYSKKLLDDVLRRDYSINALAMPKSLVLVDLVGGEKDLKSRIIRILGNPKIRFREDPLRILRGLSLMAKLNFTIENRTLKGMLKCRKNLNEISMVKLTGELTNIFRLPFGRKTIKFINRYRIFNYVRNYQKWLKIVYRQYDKLTTLEKFCLLFKMEHKIPTNTCFNKETLNKLECIIDLTHKLEAEPLTEFDVYKYDLGDLLAADKINRILLKKYRSQAKAINKLAYKLQIKSRDDINFKPANIIAMANGRTGSFVGEIMNKIEEDLVLGKIVNEYNAIASRVAEMLVLTDFSKKPVENVEKIEVDDANIVLESNQKDGTKCEQAAFLESINNEEPTAKLIETNDIENSMTSEMEIIEELVDNEPIKMEPPSVSEQTLANNVFIEQNQSFQPDSINLEQIYFEYQRELNRMMDIKMLNLITAETSLEEIEKIRNQLLPSIRLLTIKANPKFEILLEKGLI